MFVDGDPHALEIRNVNLTFTPLEPSTLANVDYADDPDEDKDAHERLSIDKDKLSAAQLDVDDPHVASILQLFIAHNVVRRNLSACSLNTDKVNSWNIEAFCHYASYTTLLLEEQLDIADVIWYPAFTEYEADFYDQIKTHWTLKTKAQQLRAMLPAEPRRAKLSDLNLPTISSQFNELYESVNTEYNKEELLLNKLGHRVPIVVLEHLRKEQFARRKAFLAKYGQMWCAIYLSRSLLPEEHEISPPNLPKLIAAGMMAAAGLQFKRELTFAPKHNTLASTGA